jgi:flagellar hook assembly protein FlgD
MKNVFVNIAKKAGVALSLVLLMSMAFVSNISAQGTSVTKLAKHPDILAPKSLDVAVFQVENTLKFRVHLENYAGQDITIKIKNGSNKVVYEEKVKNVSKYIRKFDFSTMLDGDYTFEVSNNKDTFTKDISLQTLSARSLQINN